MPDTKPKPVDDAKRLIENAGYTVQVIIKRDAESALFISDYGRPHTAWWGKDKLGNRKAFVDDGFEAVPHAYTFDQ